jgi:hypothetical protein
VIKKRADLMLRDGRRCNANQITAHAESLAGEAVVFANLEQEIEGRLSRGFDLISCELSKLVVLFRWTTVQQATISFFSDIAS